MSKITKCQSTLRTSWKKKVEERSRKKSIKDFERSLKEEKKKKLEVIIGSVQLFAVICEIVISSYKCYVVFSVKTTFLSIVDIMFAMWGGFNLLFHSAVAVASM